MKIIDYLYKFDRRLISPIGMGYSDLSFLCLSYMEFIKALGFKTYIHRSGLEQVVENQINSVEDIRDIKNNITFDYSIFERELNALEEIKADDKLIGGGCYGPLTIASQIIGIEKANRMSIKNPDVLIELIQHVTKYIIELVEKEEKKGADFIWIAEPVASLFSPKMFEIFSGNYLKQIYGSINIPGFLHVCGKTTKHTPYMLKTGAQVFSIDHVTDIEKNIAIVPEDVVVMGNIDPMILYGGDKEKISKVVNKVNYSVRNYKNFIMSTGCLIPGNTDEECINILVDITKNYKIRSNEEFKIIRRLMNLFYDNKTEELKKYIKKNHIDKKLINEAIDETKKKLRCLKKDETFINNIELY